MRFLATVYGLLLVYGTLFPLAEWSTPGVSIWDTMLAGGVERRSAPDIVTNILVYIPFGLFLYGTVAGRLRGFPAIFLVSLVGAVLSFSLEYLQAYLPHRVPSILDVILNAGGTLLGALFARVFQPSSKVGRLVLTLRHVYIVPGGVANLGLIGLGLWTLSQLSPLVPSIDLSNLAHGLKPLLQVFKGKMALNPAHATVYFFAVTGIGLVLHDVLRPGKRKILFLGFVLAVLMLKIPVVSRQLSFEAIIGSGAAFLVYLTVNRMPRFTRLKFAAIAIIGAVIVEGLRAEPGAPIWDLRAFNWIPFKAHLTNTLIGFADILAGLWPFVALCFIAIRLMGEYRRSVSVVGGLLVFCGMFLLEWNQQNVPGRHADITDALLAWVAWFIPWHLPQFRGAGGEHGFNESELQVRDARPRSNFRFKNISRPIIVAAIVLISLGSLAYLTDDKFVEVPLDESTWYKLPGSDELPEPALPNFRMAHPRLPAPSRNDRVRLSIENPGLLQKAKKRAKGGKGKFKHVILAAVLEPGSQNLDVLHRGLMKLKFTSRGHGSVKPIAIAYDWLYDHWSQSQREQLRAKLAEGAEYIIYRIREKQRLSPYNVYLYNSPLQALMAASIALYGDSPRGNRIMRFTYDYWKHRVIPVWRQVMGKNGGWHEGKEYVGIGIGQAIYQLPAMWRKATGEDYFSSDPGIRGFLDFLVYRRRPDNTDFRWGDGGNFHRSVDDQLALALEFQHAAAYTISGCKSKVQPTSWPWGPLTDARLCDQSARQRLQSIHYFDGLGLIVGRSDWSPDATYVTFKAGDNFWSHTHLDQGAFTIYKGGALAIDSGLYESYGDDAHFNYTYQTIAHNTVTVTDPEDTVPAPRKDEPRPIANDGGQRRVGSGWGIEAAPLHLKEWQEKKEIYHTASMNNVFIQDNLAVGIADLTSAYTNAYSGKESFSHRTRRVEKFVRTFGYDKQDDVIVIFDRVTSTDSSFFKRWLLHTIYTPQRTIDGFVATVSRKNQVGHKGGRLQGHVLLPKQANIQFMGGPGFEFYVEGKNYALDKRTVKRLISDKGAEPGSWRIEVSPSYENTEDVFLVVLLPTLGDRIPMHKVRLLEESGRIGCEIVGPSRLTRWWFDQKPGQGLTIEVTGGIGGTRNHRIDGDQSLYQQP